MSDFGDHFSGPLETEHSTPALLGGLTTDSTGPLHSISSGQMALVLGPDYGPAAGLVHRFLDRWVPKRVIVNCEHRPYLHRWFLFRSEALGIFIHKFVRSDEDRALHDHPWSFLVIPLWRGYIEHSQTEDEGLSAWIEKYPEEARRYRIIEADAFAPAKRRVRPILGIRFRPATYRHRVELISERPAWSLFIRFKKVRDWGFWPKSEFVQWNKWWQVNCK